MTKINFSLNLRQLALVKSALVQESENAAQSVKAAVKLDLPDVVNTMLVRHSDIAGTIAAIDAAVEAWKVS